MGGAFAQCGHTPEPRRAPLTVLPYHARLEVGFSLFVAVSKSCLRYKRPGPRACACVVVVRRFLLSFRFAVFLSRVLASRASASGARHLLCEWRRLLYFVGGDTLLRVETYCAWRGTRISQGLMGVSDQEGIEALAPCSTLPFGHAGSGSSAGASEWRHRQIPNTGLFRAWLSATLLASASLPVNIEECHWRGPYMRPSRHPVTPSHQTAVD